MVHALDEIWRVLKPEGILVDVRPLSSDPPVEIVRESGSVSAGHLDDSPGLPKDEEADQAIAAAAQRGDFVLEQKTRFRMAFYWEKLADMTAYAQARWSNSVIVPSGVIERAARIIEGSDGPIQVRIPQTIHLAKYCKRAPAGRSTGPGR